ncbi:gephyrin-like molybdotransferase Glp [Rathayibacter sp. KR2-224]|uniref:molybdopterin molybdotransferase MoeA n=1 Tax=Rathayibacter sp. KR2-224 TaxID=3400913 RepID=UPI003C093E88
MITVEQHLAHVLKDARPLTHERVPVGQALGRVLAADVVATAPSPPFDNSAMDGYALRSADAANATATAPVALRVVGEVSAGSSVDPRIPVGAAVRIMTGAALPTDADTVVPIERTVEHDWGADPVRLDEQAAVGANIRRAGEDLEVSGVVATAGRRLTAFDIAGIAASGAADVRVTRRPLVAVVTTGDELVEAGGELRRGAVYDSNGPLVVGLLTEAGCTVVHRSRVGDASGELESVLHDVLRSPVDVVLLTGGVGPGAHDPVGRLDLRRVNVAMQPGKPQAFGRLDGVPVFGLPGNPVSVAVSFHVFVLPLLRALQGLRPEAAVEQAVAEVGWRTPPARRQYLPVATQRSGGALLVRPANDRGSASHLIGRLGAADGFGIVPAEVAEVRAGDRIAVMLFE